MAVQQQLRFVKKERTEFFSVLKKRVDGYFKENNISKYGNQTLTIKAIALVSIYILPLLAILTFNPPFWVALLLWAVSGFGMAGCGMSVMHDANHGSWSANAKVNKRVAGVLHLLGGSCINWKIQHNLLHHTYTNIVTHDEDIQDRLVLKFNPHTAVRWYHPFQYIYAFFFYGLMTFYWVTLKDIVQYFKFIKLGANTQSPAENRKLLGGIILNKIGYFSIMIIAPILVWHIPALQIIGGFMLMHFVGGIILTITFQLAHTLEGTSHPLGDEKGIVENDWAIHQLNTTINFSTKNKFFTWYMGGLNYQVEHHLFPRISHVHYPALAPIVKATAEEYGVPYLENETFAKAFKDHVTALKSFGHVPNLNEAIA